MKVSWRADRSNDVEAVELGDGRRIHGFADEGYGRIVDTFAKNFVERRDLGAACTVYVAGRIAVELWGGIADRRVERPWQPETSVVIFSCSKGVLAICAYLLVQAGRLDLDAPVASYWPAFGKHGKAAITVREAMSHRAGVPSLDVDLTKDEVLAWDPVIRAIEEQGPLFPPSAGHLYHALTYGWIIGEVIRCVTGITPGRYFRQAVADRLHLQTWIGLPHDERASVAWMEPPLPDEDSAVAREAARILHHDPIVERSFSMGGAFAFPVEDGLVTFNDPMIQAAEIPGANGISTAGSLARLYAACVSAVGGPRLLSDESIEDALAFQATGMQLTGVPDDGACWGTGFQLSSPPSQPLLGRRSFGHAGAGGQLGFADLERQVGFAYLTNQMGGYGDARARELTLALSTILDG